MKSFFLIIATTLSLFSCKNIQGQKMPSLEEANPLRPLPTTPLGLDIQLSEIENPPTKERVRLGRWLFFDSRLSKDGSISCSTCHIPEHAFSEPTPVSTGIGGQKGNRKSPSFVNQYYTLFPHFFWDGRASSLEEQAKGPIENPIEMGSTHEFSVDTIRNVKGYRKYFKEAFGDEEITIDRIAKAIADYERTRMSGNSKYDRFINREKGVLTAQEEKGRELFFGKAECNQCHFGQNFTDSLFHNLGIGWDPKAKKFSDEGRYVVSKKPEDIGAFKTPTVRDVSKHAPYMHDGSIQTLREVVEHYNKGGIKNPHLSPKIRPLNLSEIEIDALVAFMHALDGEGYLDEKPEAFPQ